MPYDNYAHLDRPGLSRGGQPGRDFLAARGQTHEYETSG